MATLTLALDGGLSLVWWWCSRARGLGTAGWLRKITVVRSIEVRADGVESVLESSKVSLRTGRVGQAWLDDQRDSTGGQAMALDVIVVLATVGMESLLLASARARWNLLVELRLLDASEGGLGGVLGQDGGRESESSESELHYCLFVSAFVLGVTKVVVRVEKGGCRGKAGSKERLVAG